MHSELIDKLYDNEAVEGVALFNISGELIENQLALGERAATQIGNCLINLKSGLAGARRNMKGLVFKTKNYLLQVIMHDDLLILLQLGQGHSLDNLHAKITSQLGPAIRALPVQPSSNTNSTKEPVTNTVAQPAQAETQATEHAPMISWDIFHGSLSTLLKRVAPSNIANKMIALAALEHGVAEGQDQHIPLENAFTIGQMVVDKIPNASRRKLIQKEYDLLVKQYS